MWEDGRVGDWEVRDCERETSGVCVCVYETVCVCVCVCVSLGGPFGFVRDLSLAPLLSRGPPLLFWGPSLPRKQKKEKRFF